MDPEIGAAAGDVYQFLHTNGPAAVSRIQNATGHKAALVNQAIGWLAREEKIVREVHPRAVRWRLAQP